MPYESFTDGDYIAGRKTDAGRSGKNNEDDFALFTTRYAPGDGAMGVLPVTVAVVADGIGGNVAGELASRETIRTMVDVMDGAPQAPVGERMVDAVRRANATLIRRAEVDPSLQGMGTTVVAAAVVNHTLFVVHVGDSRAYLIRNGEALPLTVDHSWAQEAIAAGRLSPAEAEAHPNRHVIKRFLGLDEGLEVDAQMRDPATRGPMITQLPLLPGDQVLLCTDGLTDVVSDGEISALTAKHAPQAAAEKLVQAANRAGGPDNITVVILERPDPNVPRAAAGGRTMRGALIAAALLVVVAGLAWLLATRFMGDSVSGPEDVPGVVAEAASSEPTSLTEDTLIDASAPISTPVEADPVATATVALEEPPPEAVTITSSTEVTQSTVVTAAVVAETATLSAAATLTPEPHTPTVAPPPTTGDGTSAIGTAFTTTPEYLVVTPAPVGEEHVAQALLPTSTPRPLSTETATPLPPTSTPVRDTPTPTVSPTWTATNTPRVTATPVWMGLIVTLRTPMDGASGSGSVTFSWEPNRIPPPGFAFEPVFWRGDQDPMQHGEGWGGTTLNNELAIKFDNRAPEKYYWGVLLVVPDDRSTVENEYKREAYLGGGHTYVLTSSGGGGNDGPPCPPNCSR